MRFTTLREEKIETIYKKLSINDVSDLGIDHLATLFNFKIMYYNHRSQSVYDDNCGLMYLNQKQPYAKIRYDFFHEFAHFFEHCSDQRKKFLTKDFIKLQERQAYWFAMHASMPRFIFEPIMQQATSIRELAELLQLPTRFVAERVRFLRQQTNTHAYYENMKQREDARINRSLQPGKVYDTTISVLKQLQSQVGEENLHYDVKNLLR